MGSTSFLGFSYPNLLLVFFLFVFSEPVIFRNLFHIFVASVGTFSYRYFYVPYFGLACTWYIKRTI